MKNNILILFLTVFIGCTQTSAAPEIDISKIPTQEMDCSILKINTNITRFTQRYFLCDIKTKGKTCIFGEETDDANFQCWNTNN